MRVRHFACAGLMLLGSLSGCATWQKPSADLATRIPVIEIGQPKPEGNEYILLVRAGKDIPVKLTVDGSFLSKEGATETTVNVRQDVYLYKQWSSFYGKEWERGLFQVLISAGVSPEGGNVDIKVNQSN